MAEESHYSSVNDTPNSAAHKRKYEDHAAVPSNRSRPTGFSSPNAALPPPPPLPNQQQPPPQSYNSVPPPDDGFQAAKQRAQEIAARLLAAASSDPKRSRVDNGSSVSSIDSADSKPYGWTNNADAKPSFSSGQSPVQNSYSSYMASTSKKIEIPNGRVGVIIGKGGETIKYLQIQSGAKIQVTRDMDVDPNALMRPVELMGTPDQIDKAEQLINDVLAEVSIGAQADAGGSGTVSRRFTGGQGGSDHIVLKVPNSKVGLVIGKGGETIKNMQARTGARIQVIPLHLPPGDTSQERSVHIDGTNDQIEAAKQLINEVISSENRMRNQSMGGGYSQQGYSQGYQARPPTNWAPSGGPLMQQGGYGYMQPGSYSGQAPPYNMSQPQYAGYPQQTSGGYPSNWEQSGQQTSQPYDYYGQPPAQQQPNAVSTDSAGYNYNHPPASGYMQQGQAYSQDGYGGYAQSGYGAPPYDQQAYGYGNTANSNQEGHTSYGAQGDSAQASPQPPAGQQNYNSSQQPSPSPASYPPQATSQPGYGVAPTSQAAYGNAPSAQPGYGSSYGPPPAQKPPGNAAAYGQAQQSPSTGYGQLPSSQAGYSHPQAASDSGSQRAPPAYGAASGQPGYGPPYGAPPPGQPGYGQMPPAPYGSYGSGYPQPAPYSSDATASNNGRSAYDTAPPAQPAQPSGVAKASPPS